MTPGSWPPAVVLIVGALLATLGVRAQRSLELRTPLAEAVPRNIGAYGSGDMTLSEAEVRVAGVTTYLFRTYRPSDTTATGPGPRFATLYVGYYDRQTQGRTIHSPKNCLPGSGWEPLTSVTATIALPGGPVFVNRYLIQKGNQQALVLYWYQGRGRIAHDEYMVKWELVRDAALHRRSEEALVRLVVPVVGQDVDASFMVAAHLARDVIPALSTALPAS